MNIVHSRKVRPVERSPKMAALLETIANAQLREWVEHISVPRHFVAEPERNRATAAWLCSEFQAMGFRVERQGEFDNIVAMPDFLKNGRRRREETLTPPEEKVSELTSAATMDSEGAILVGAHYDSVPMCPGADDNGSAVAAMLGCAAACSLWRPVLPVVFVAFNREEDGLMGSRDFVKSYLPQAPFEVIAAHILEMVGCASSVPGSQRVPTGLPIKISDTGDFLGLLANGDSAACMNVVLSHAGAYVPELPVTGLNVKLGLEKFFPVLSRSDHAPFWMAHIPAVMWTDTSEFRNQNYHRHTDTPDTLDYRFLRSVTQLLTACVIAQAGELGGQNT